MASLRTHLTACIENEHFPPFPKESYRVKNVKIVINKNVRTIQNTCRCGLPGFVDDMVGVKTESVENGSI